MRLDLNTAHNRTGIDGSSMSLEIACATKDALELMLGELRAMRVELQGVRADSAKMLIVMKDGCKEAELGRAKADEVIEEIKKDVEDRKAARVK